MAKRPGSKELSDFSEMKSQRRAAACYHCKREAALAQTRATAPKLDFNRYTPTRAQFRASWT